MWIKLYNLISDLYWRNKRFRRTLKYLAQATVLALISMALGLLLNDMWRGYGIVVCVYISHGIAEWIKEEFQFD